MNVNRIEVEHQRAETLRQCHEIVWAYREQLESVWPCPDIWDSLLFCQTELGEAIDAYLRTKQGYARNNAKDLDVLDELADVALMAFTALGKDHQEVCGWWKSYEDIERFGDSDYESWAAYTAYLAEALDSAVNFYDDPRGYVRPLVMLLNYLAVHPNMDLPARLTARLERIKAKRLPVEAA